MRAPLHGAQALLLALLRVDASPGGASQLANRLDAAAWTHFAGLVKRHGVGGLVRDRLAAFGITPAPEAAAGVRTAAERALFTGLRAQAVLHDASAILAEAGCGPVAPLKGAHLLASLYATPGARATTDVDLLIPAGSRELAHAALVDAGYRYVPKPHGRPASQRNNYERSYLSPRGVLVDVHGGLCQPERAALDYAGMLSRAVQADDRHPWAPEAVLLTAEDTLLVLAVHMAQDCFAGPLRQLVDVAWWVDRARPDLALAVERARAAGALTVLWVTLREAERRLGAPIPEVIMRLARPTNAVRRAYLDRLLRTGELAPYPFAHAKRWAQVLTLAPLLDTPRQGMELTLRYAWLRTQDLAERRSGLQIVG